MKFDDNISEVIKFIEEEINFEELLEKIFNEDLNDDQFEKIIFEYVEFFINEIAKTLHIDYEIAKTLYDEYLTRTILEAI